MKFKLKLKVSYSDGDHLVQILEFNEQGIVIFRTIQTFKSREKAEQYIDIYNDSVVHTSTPTRYARAYNFVANKKEKYERPAYT